VPSSRATHLVKLSLLVLCAGMRTPLVPGGPGGPCYSQQPYLLLSWLPGSRPWVAPDGYAMLPTAWGCMGVHTSCMLGFLCFLFDVVASSVSHDLAVSLGVCGASRAVPRTRGHVGVGMAGSRPGGAVVR
jgi:hypothetical protein